VDCQEYNFIEEKYTEACLSYIDEHNMRVEDLINEEDIEQIWKYIK
jgi:hypothetical protein